MSAEPPSIGHSNDALALENKSIKLDDLHDYVGLVEDKENNKDE